MGREAAVKKRDISHVQRDDLGRWQYTPSAHADVVVSEETSSQLPPIHTQHVDYLKHADKPDLEYMEEIVSRLRDQYAQIEPGVSLRMQKMAKKVGGTLEDLEHRLKTENSMVSKLWKGMMRHKSDVDTSVDYLTDTLRYTMVIPKDEFVKGVKKSFALLGEAGYKPYLPRTFKYNGRSYKGLNAVFQRKDGHFIEVQFHTPATYFAKERSHKLYEVAREMRRSNPQKYDLVQRMRQEWIGVTLPKSFDELPGRWA